MIAPAAIPTVEAVDLPHIGAAVLLWVLLAVVAVSQVAALPIAVVEVACLEVVEGNKII